MIQKAILILFGVLIASLVLQSDLFRSVPENPDDVFHKRAEPVAWVAGLWKVYAKRNYKPEPFVLKIENGSSITNYPDGTPLQMVIHYSSDTEVILSESPGRENLFVKPFPLLRKIEKISDEKMLFWFRGITPKTSNVFFAERVSAEDL